MGNMTLMSDPATGHVALFEEPFGSGAYTDPASARNLPLRQPENYLGYVHLHTALDQMEVVAYQPSLSVTHPKVRGRSPTEIDGVANVSVSPGVDRVDRLLFTHSLGYVPHFLVAINGVILSPGFPVQVLSGGGRSRYVTAYATATEIRLSEISVVTADDLPAVAVTYQLLVFREAPAPSGSVVLEYSSANGLVTMGFGRFRSDRAYLQVLPQGTGTPFALPNGPTIDVKNGAPVMAKASGEMVLAMPDLRYTMVQGRPFGLAMQYNGSFAPPPTIPVQAP